MTSIALADAAPQLADLVERARAGEEVVLYKDGRPQVRLEPVKEAINDDEAARAQRLAAVQAIDKFRRLLRRDQRATHDELVADKNFGRL